jgi:hypothetical protein
MNTDGVGRGGGAKVALKQHTIIHTSMEEAIVIVFLEQALLYTTESDQQ